MTNQSLEKAMLFLAAWREAGQWGEQAMMAVAFALRNRQRNSWEGGSWINIIKNYNRLRYNDFVPSQDFPELRDPVIHRFMTKIDSIYDGSAIDNLTSTQQFVIAVQPGAEATGLHTGVLTGKYWAILSEITNEKFLSAIVRNPENHPKTSQVGPITFFA